MDNKHTTITREIQYLETLSLKSRANIIRRNNFFIMPDYMINKRRIVFSTLYETDKYFPKVALKFSF